jgi:hypothetical protein
MGKLPSIQFYPGDWLRDPVSTCSLAAQGLWLRMLLVAHDSAPYGYLVHKGAPIPPEQIARRCGCTLAEYTTLLAELDGVGVPERTPTGVIFSRRMVRDAKKRAEARRYGKLGGNPHLKDESHGGDKGGVNPPLKRKKKMKGKSSGEGGAGEEVAFFALIPDSLRTPKFLDAWAAWIEHRRQRRPAYTEVSARRALPKLAEEGPAAAIARIDRSIVNGYQGLFFHGENGAANGHRPTAREQRDALIEQALDEE